MEFPHIDYFRFSVSSDTPDFDYEELQAELMAYSHTVARWSATREAARNPGQTVDVVVPGGQIIGHVVGVPRSQSQRTARCRSSALRGIQ